MLVLGSPELTGRFHGKILNLLPKGGVTVEYCARVNSAGPNMVIKSFCYAGLLLQGAISPKM